MTDPSTAVVRYFVLGSRTELEAWCQTHGFSPRDRAVIHITTHRQTLGHRLNPQDEIHRLPSADFAAGHSLEARRAERAQDGHEAGGVS